MVKYKAVLFSQSGNEYNLNRVYTPTAMMRLQSITELLPEAVGPHNLEQYKVELAEVEYGFSTWGMPAFTGDMIDTYLPKLKAVFYAAGTVQGFAKPFLDRGIRVFSAWKANGISVIQWTVAEILLASKGFFHSIDRTRQNYRDAGHVAGMMPGNYGISVGILGAGVIGSGVIQSLQGMLHDKNEMQIKVFDPFLPKEKAEAWGIELVSLEKACACDIVSNHLANKEEIRGILNYAVLSKMPSKGIFINTGRGAQVVEADLLRVMQEEPMRVAVLDVTDPEPPIQDSAFMQQPNIFFTPHMAGSSGQECERQAHFMMDAYLNVCASLPSDCEVTPVMLATMA